MKFKRLYIFCFCIVFSYVLKCQSLSFNFAENMRFTDYLIKNNLTDDALVLLKSLDHQKNLTFSQTDSINFAIAEIYFHQEQFDSAVYYYEKVSSNSPCSLKSGFFQSAAYLKTDSISLAVNTLSKIPANDSLMSELIQFQLSGASLLQRNFSSFDNYSKNFTFMNQNMNMEEKKMLDYSFKLKNLKSKSPFVASALSAIIPGLGKVYAGKTKQGISAFIPVTILGLQTYEAYAKAGIKSPRFIIFGNLFSVFYIGNIWGSALSVHVVNQEINNEINRQILFDLDIPLQRIFR